MDKYEKLPWKLSKTREYLSKIDINGNLWVQIGMGWNEDGAHRDLESYCNIIFIQLNSGHTSICFIIIFKYM